MDSSRRAGRVLNISVHEDPAMFSGQVFIFYFFFIGSSKGESSSKDESSSQVEDSSQVESSSKDECSSEVEPSSKVECSSKVESSSSFAWEIQIFWRQRSLCDPWSDRKPRDSR